MADIFTTACFWLALALFAAVLAYHLKISIALVEICAGVMAGFFFERYIGFDFLKTNDEWLKFLASAGAVMLTFLAGAELEPAVLRSKMKEVITVGSISFFMPFAGCAAIACFVLGWSSQSSLLAGVALSCTSVAVVYAVMLETGLNKTEFGKGILASCFVTDLGTVLALSLIFSPFTYKTLIFAGVSVLALLLLPYITSGLTKIYAYRTAAVRTKWVILVLFGLGALALWSGSEAVLPAYLVGMALAGAAARDGFWIRRLRTLTIGFLTPFYFIRVGTLVSLPAVTAAPLVFILLLSGKVLTKVFGLYPAIAPFRKDKRERWYYTLMMSPGLTFGTIAAVYGHTHGIVSRGQYSFLVAVIIASAVVPTLIANAAFLPKHLIPKEKDVHLDADNGEGLG